jgi:hypothetical protein
MNMRTTIILAMTAIFAISGCIGWARTREYVPDRGKTIPLVDGWSLEAEIYVYKNVTGAPTKTWDFCHEFTFRKTIHRGADSVDTVSVAEIDTVQIIFLDLDTTFVLPVREGPFWLSSISDKELCYAVNYLGSAHRLIDYPQGPHPVSLHLRVRVYPGAHKYVTQGNYYGYDSVAVDHSRVLRDTVIDAPLRFHETKSPAVGYGD